MHRVDLLDENEGIWSKGFFLCHSSCWISDPSTLFCSLTHLPVTLTSSNLIQQTCDVSVTRLIWFLISIYGRELEGGLGVSCCYFSLVFRNRQFQNHLIYLWLWAFYVLFKTILAYFYYLWDILDLSFWEKCFFVVVVDISGSMSVMNIKSVIFVLFISCIFLRNIYTIVLKVSDNWYTWVYNLIIIVKQIKHFQHVLMLICFFKYVFWMFSLSYKRHWLWFVEKFVWEKN